jgi:hypothetical protein
MRLDRELGATLTVGSGLHPSALFAPHAAVACFASRLQPRRCQFRYSVRRLCNRAILIGSNAIRNLRISLKQHAMFFSNRSRIAFLRAAFSQVLRATNHELRRTARALLIATQLLEIRLICSQQTRKLSLIATFFALWHMLGASLPTRLDSPVALTALHPSPTMKSVSCILQRIVYFVAAIADHGRLITNHHSLITGIKYV